MFLFFLALVIGYGVVYLVFLRKKMIAVLFTICFTLFYVQTKEAPVLYNILWQRFEWDETTAETIMRDALQKKKALSAEMERQSKEFDTQLEKQTEEQIKEIRRNLEGEKDKRLSSLREDTQAALSQLDAYYAKNHERLSREIFEKIIQEEVM